LNATLQSQFLQTISLFSKQWKGHATFKFLATLAFERFSESSTITGLD